MKRYLFGLFILIGCSKESTTNYIAVQTPRNLKIVTQDLDGKCEIKVEVVK